VTDRHATRVLVVGGTGMLGHKAWQILRDRMEAWCTVRDRRAVEHTGLYAGDRVIDAVTADDFASIERAFSVARPTAVVNCVGIVKQLKAASDPIPSIVINALFPHRLAALARSTGARLIHVSTDCVFAGSRGHYAEQDPPDAYDLYGRTKLLGEVAGPGCLTVRTSIIGRELAATTGLVEWLLAQRGGRVKGFTHAIFSGLTTASLARVLADVIERHASLEGVYHVAAAPITKYDLLHRLNEAFGAGVDIEPSDSLRIDRSLDGAAFARATGLSAPGWAEMVADLAHDPTPYEDWRRRRV
jgi:dTDP-4-dehydrorhamnose reductase